MQIALIECPEWDILIMPFVGDPDVVVIAVIDNDGETLFPLLYIPIEALRAYLEVNRAFKKTR